MAILHNTAPASMLRPKPQPLFILPEDEKIFSPDWQSLTCAIGAILALSVIALGGLYWLFA